MARQRAVKDNRIRGTNVWTDALNAALLERCQEELGFDAAEGGFFWDKKPDLRARIVLASPYQEEEEAFTNVSVTVSYITRMTIEVRGRMSGAQLAAEATRVLQDVRRSFNHDTDLVSRANALIDSDYPVNVRDVAVRNPVPLPVEEVDETTQMSTGEVIVDIIFEVEECLRNKVTS